MNTRRSVVKPRRAARRRGAACGGTQRHPPQGVSTSAAHAETCEACLPQRWQATRQCQAGGRPAKAPRGHGPCAARKSRTATWLAAGNPGSTRRNARRRAGDGERRRRRGTYTAERPARFAATAERSTPANKSCTRPAAARTAARCPTSPARETHRKLETKWLEPIGLWRRGHTCHET